MDQRPRIAKIGSYRDPLGFPDVALAPAIDRVAAVTPIRAAAPVRQLPLVLWRAARAVRDGAELLHLSDARFALAGLLLRRRLGVPVTASMSSLDTGARTPWGRATLRALGRIDHVFAGDDAQAQSMRTLTPRACITVVRHAASPLPWPSKRAMASVTRALRNARPGRLVVAVPWPDDRDDLRWFRDLAQPHFESRPLCLIVGAPSRREVRLLVGSDGLARDFRVVTGRLTADVIAAVARCADAFAVPSRCVATERRAAGALGVALAMGGIPVVTNGAEDALVFAHERNGFVTAPGDDREFVRTLNQVLALPAIQRHTLGEEFARYTLNRWSWDDVAEVYGERFAALVGRPQIPAALRAA